MTGLVVLIVTTLVIVSCLIIALIAIAFRLILKSAARLAEAGALDDEFIKEANDSKKKSRRILGGLSQASSSILCVLLISLVAVAGIYHVQGKQFSINDNVTFAVASNSMDGFYDNNYKNDLIKTYSLTFNIDEDLAQKQLIKDQFGVGDLVFFKQIECDCELIPYDVYGYVTSDGRIITHRLVGFTDDGLILLRGDNAPGVDIAVSREQVLYHYQGQDTKYLGLVVLFFGSGYGFFSISAVLAIFVVTEITVFKFEKIKKTRLEALGIEYKPKKKRKAKAINA